MTKADTYEAGGDLTFEMVGQHKAFRPLFALPPKDTALIASLYDVGPQLCRNQAARELLRALLLECDRRELGDYPTVLMLQACLELHQIPIERVPFAELGIKVEAGKE